MNMLELTDTDAGEAWLFADLFASILMSIILLINAHSVATEPGVTHDSGSEPVETRLLYIVDMDRVLFDTPDGQTPVPLLQAVDALKMNQEQVEVIGRAHNTPQELFQLFSELQKAGIRYRYSI